MTTTQDTTARQTTARHIGAEHTGAEHTGAEHTGAEHTATDPAVGELVAAFRRALEAGRGRDLGALYTADAVADLTVPNWRYRAVGPEAIGENFAGWFGHPARFEEFEVHPTATGVTLVYTLAWEEDGMPHAAHHGHVMELCDGRIRRDTVFCGGRWSATLLAEMEDAARAG